MTKLEKLIQELEHVNINTPTDMQGAKIDSLKKAIKKEEDRLAKEKKLPYTGKAPTKVK